MHKMIKKGSVIYAVTIVELFQRSTAKDVLYIHTPFWSAGWRFTI